MTERLADSESKVEDLMAALEDSIQRARDARDAALASAINGRSDDYSHLDHLCTQCQGSGRSDCKFPMGSDCKFPMECENDGWGDA